MRQGSTTWSGLRRRANSGELLLDPESIKRDIDQARDQLAVTASTPRRAGQPQRLADDFKSAVIGLIKKPAVTASLAGAGVLVVVVGRVGGSSGADGLVRRSARATGYAAQRADPYAAQRGRRRNRSQSANEKPGWIGTCRSGPPEAIRYR